MVVGSVVTGASWSWSVGQPLQVERMMAWVGGLVEDGGIACSSAEAEGRGIHEGARMLTRGSQPRARRGWVGSMLDGSRAGGGCSFGGVCDGVCGGVRLFDKLWGDRVLATDLFGPALWRSSRRVS